MPDRRYNRTAVWIDASDVKRLNASQIVKDRPKERELVAQLSETLDQRLLALAELALCRYVRLTLLSKESAEIVIACGYAREAMCCRELPVEGHR